MLDKIYKLSSFGWMYVYKRDIIMIRNKTVYYK